MRSKIFAALFGAIGLALLVGCESTSSGESIYTNGTTRTTQVTHATPTKGTSGGNMPSKGRAGEHKVLLHHH